MRGWTRNGAEQLGAASSRARAALIHRLLTVTGWGQIDMTGSGPAAAASAAASHSSASATAFSDACRPVSPQQQGRVVALQATATADTDAAKSTAVPLLPLLRLEELSYREADADRACAAAPAGSWCGGSAAAEGGARGGAGAALRGGAADRAGVGGRRPAVAVGPQAHRTGTGTDSDGRLGWPTRMPDSD